MKTMDDTNEENVLGPLSNRNAARNTPRMFRNPPQPHMCVQVSLKSPNNGPEHQCFINVMAWSKIELPSQPDAPVPLYGGVLVPVSDRSVYFAGCGKNKPLVFAVLANPYVLQTKGKYASNLQERDALIDLMLDFVEAMNPNIQFSRDFTVLRDRDLTGELKEIWAIIQAKRESQKQLAANSILPVYDENSVPCSGDGNKLKTSTPSYERGDQIALAEMQTTSQCSRDLNKTENMESGS